MTSEIDEKDTETLEKAAAVKGMLRQHGFNKSEDVREFTTDGHDKAKHDNKMAETCLNLLEHLPVKATFGNIEDIAADASEVRLWLLGFALTRDPHPESLAGISQRACIDRMADLLGVNRLAGTDDLVYALESLLEGRGMCEAERDEAIQMLESFVLEPPATARTIPATITEALRILKRGD